MKITGQFLRFGMVGAAGFVVDVSVLYLMQHLGLGLYSARVVSFLAAATSTWLGNRRFTFQPHRRGGMNIPGEWMVYLVAMALGGSANYLTYALLISYLPLFYQHPWLGVACGTGAGLLINFILARKILHTAAG